MPTRNITGAKTTWISSREPDRNLEAFSYMASGQTGSPSYLTNAFIKFDDDAEWSARIPSGARITHAVLVLFARQVHGGSFTSHGVWLPPSNWNPASHTWNRRDAATTGPENTFSVNQGQTATVDLASWVRRAISSRTLRVYGLVIASRSLDNYGLRTDFDSRRGTNPPRLRVTYDAVPPFHSTPTVNAAGNAVPLSGPGVASAQRVQVVRHTENSSTGGTGLGNASLSGDDWSYVDRPPLPAPNSPTNLDASLRDTSARLSWTGASQDTGTYYYRSRRILSDGTTSGWSTIRRANFTPNIVAYRIFRRTGSGDFQQIARIGASARAYVDDTVVAGSSYVYAIQAENSTGQTSANSGHASFSLYTPSRPVLSSVEVTPQRLFRLTGTITQGDVSAGVKVVPYISADGTRFFARTSFDPGSTSWTTDQPVANTPAPPAPEITGHVPSGAHLVISWDQAANDPVIRWFRVTGEAGGIEGLPSATRRAQYTPEVTSYRLERRIAANASDPWQTVYEGSERFAEDRTGTPGTRYAYRVTSTNERQVASSPSTVVPGDYPLPLPPTDVAAEVLERTSVRVSGAGFLDADSLVVERSSGGAWSRAGEAALGSVPTRPEAEWRLTDEPAVAAPNRPAWVGSSASREGITLLWERPVNPASDYLYRAHRLKSGVRSTDSEVVAARLTPRVASFVLERREVFTDASGNPTGEVSGFRRVTTLTEQRYTDPIDNTDPGAISTDAIYDYRVRAVNERSVVGTFSVHRRHETYRLPEDAPAPVLAPPPVLSRPEPVGVVEVRSGETSASTIRVGWTYEAESPQDSYTLKLYTPGGVFYWTGTAWSSSVASVQSTESRVEVPAATPLGPLVSHEVYRFALVVRSRAGGVSGRVGIAEETPEEAFAEEEEFSWEFTVAVQGVLRVPTRRLVSRLGERDVPTLRKVTSAEAPYRIGFIVDWAVAPRLTSRPAPTGFSSGETLRPWTVSDNTGRPEPYAEVDFQQGSYTKTFFADSRGRFLIRLPTDLTPGIYTVRERGPSMAPRTYDNVPITDPWAVYSHGERHRADGEDPVVITDAQVSPNAGVGPWKVLGAEGLAEMVAHFGVDAVPGLERHLSSGHASFTVRGLGCSPTVEGELPAVLVEPGACWEGGRFREVSGTTLPLNEDAVFAVFVQNGRAVTGSSFPPGTAPIAVATVSSGEPLDGEVSVEDARTYHPQSTVTGDVTPVVWGGTRSTEIAHGEESLSEVLDRAERERRAQTEEQSRLARRFEEGILAIQGEIDRESSRRRRARDLLLATSLASRVSALLSAIDGHPVPLSPDIRAFRSGEEVSSLTELVVDPATGDRAAYSPAYLTDALEHSESPEAFAQWVREEGYLGFTPGRAVLPEKWSARETYTLRSLRIRAPRSTVLRLAVLYEPTGARFAADASLADEGRYLPRAMNLLRTEEVPDPAAQRPLYMDLWEAEFPSSGAEAVVALRCRGGTTEEGVVIRGFAVVSA